MASVRRDELVITRGEDVWVWDEDGRRYLDATASLWYANVGHGRREIVEAAAAQMSRLEAYSIFNDLANPPALALAKRLSSLAPMPGAKVFLGNGGGDAVEAAIKLARLYSVAAGGSSRTQIISRAGSYHGTHGIGTSLGGIPDNRIGFDPLTPGISIVDAADPEALVVEIGRVGADTVCAFIFEPVLGAGGVYPPAPGYVERVAEICREHRILLIVDSTICGFGRMGTWFGIERWDVEPDMVIFAKGVTSGYLPLGGLLVSGRVAAPFWENEGVSFRHGQTYAGHATCCAAALANIDILERDDLVRRGAELEDELYGVLAPLEDHELVGEVRGGTGFFAAVELDPDLLARDPRAVEALYRRTRERGVLVRPLLRGVAVSPPLTIGSAELGLIGEAVSDALDAVSSGDVAIVAGPTRSP
jgi:adenosylmethionine-8-amino-7-oxononanoate aminotransferase